MGSRWRWFRCARTEARPFAFRLRSQTPIAGYALRSLPSSPASIAPSFTIAATELGGRAGPIRPFQICRKIAASLIPAASSQATSARCSRRRRPYAGQPLRSRYGGAQPSSETQSLAGWRHGGTGSGEPLELRQQGSNLMLGSMKHWKRRNLSARTGRVRPHMPHFA